ncbi:MAG: HAD hydrolase-like protein, partial [Clostridia bacterium]
QFLSNNMMTGFTYVLSEKNIFGKDKPIRHLLKILGLDSKEAVYVGDELRDIEACKKVPIRIISAAWAGDCRTLIQKGEPNHIAEHPMEILDILKEME